MYVCMSYVCLMIPVLLNALLSVTESFFILMCRLSQIGSMRYVSFILSHQQSARVLVATYQWYC